MKLGLELIAREPVTFRLGTFFETWIATPAGTVRRSLGRDEYHLGLTIDRGRRLAATGRTHICQLDLEAADMGPNQAREATPVPAEIGPGVPVIWGIRTNLFLDEGALIRGASGRLLLDDRPPLEFPLDHPVLVVESVAPGRFVLDVSAVMLTGAD